MAGVPASAQDAKATPAMQGAMKRLQSGSTWEVAWDRDYGQVESLSGRWRGPVADPEQVASDFLRTYADLFEVPQDLADLSIADRRESLSGVHFNFKQSWNGLPVFNGGIDVHVSRAGEVFLVNNRYARPGAFGKLSPLPAVTADGALDAIRMSPSRVTRTDKAGRPMGPAPLTAASPPALGVYRGAKGLELAWQTVADGVRYTVSAQSGAILEETPLAQFVNGTGQVFNPNPVNSLKDTSLRDLNNTNYAEIQPAYVTKALVGIKKAGAPAQYSLVGPFVKAFDATQAFLDGACGSSGTRVAKGPPVRADTAFIYNRSEPGFEFSNVYYHIDHSQRYLQSLGFTTLINTGIKVDAHAFSDDNSYFCPASGGYLAFGDGGVDDAEDADVVLHEYGHAIQHFSSGGRYGGGGQAGAMGEGFGDYWSFSAKPGGFKPACFAEFDVNTGGCLRRLDKNKKFPANYVGEVHADGEIWSRALRDLFLKVGKQTADKLIIESHFLIADAPTFSKGAKALLDADEQLFAGANKNDICAVMTDRGISTPSCGYWIKLSWSDVGADIDLHLRHPDGYDFVGYNYINDCAYYNLNPDWGVASDTTDNPLLYQDCTSSCAFEQITVDKLTTPGRYKVLVHFYAAHTAATSTTASVEVFRGPKKLYTGSQVISNTGGSASTGDVWVPFEINIAATAGKAPQVNAIGTVQKMPSPTGDVKKE